MIMIMTTTAGQAVAGTITITTGPEPAVSRLGTTRGMFPIVGLV
jgi:hypothetical protein